MAYDAEYYRRYRELHRDRIRERKRREYLANREAIKARSRQWSLNNRERKLAVQQDYRERKRSGRNAYMRDRYQRNATAHIAAMSAWRRANPEKYKAQYLASEYGITLQEYATRLADQDGACAICRRVPSRSLAVDHDHVSGRVRGLLCSTCNSGLGHFKDDPGRLRAAAEYVERSLADGRR